MGKQIFLLTLCVFSNLSADHGTLKGRCGRRNSTSDIPSKKKPMHARTQSATLPAPLPAPAVEPVATEEPKAVEAPQLVPESVPVEIQPAEEPQALPSSSSTNTVLKASLVTIFSAAVVGIGYQLLTAAPEVVIRAAEVKKVTHES